MILKYKYLLWVAGAFEIIYNIFHRLPKLSWAMLNFLTEDLSREEIFGSLHIDEDGKESGKKSIYRVRLAKQQLCTCITLFCTFLCRRCSTTKWKCLISRFVEDVNEDNDFPTLSFPEEGNTVFLSICRHLTIWTSWNKHDKVWSSANSLFKWHFRRRCLRC